MPSTSWQKESDDTGNNLNVGHYVQTQEEIILPTVEVQNTSLEAAKISFGKAQEHILALLRQHEKSHATLRDREDIKGKAVKVISSAPAYYLTSVRQRLNISAKVLRCSPA